MAYGSTRDAVIHWCRRDGTPGSVLHTISAVHDESLTGEDTLEVECYSYPDKNELLVWQDAGGAWHEHRVESYTVTHDTAGQAIAKVTAINSIAILYDEPIIDMEFTNGTCDGMLRALLNSSGPTGAGSRFFEAGGATDVSGTWTHRFFHTSTREAIAELCEHYGCELEVQITVANNAVTHREVYLVPQRGEQGRARRFEYRRNMASVTKTVDARDVITRVIAYGKAEQVSTTNLTDAQRAELAAYPNRLNINGTYGGCPYVEDADAVELFGDSYGYYVDSSCESASELRAAALDYLAENKDPLITYRATLTEVTLSQRKPWLEVRVGDLVDVVDHEWVPELRVRARVSRVRRYIVGRTPTEGVVEITNKEAADIMRADVKAAKERRSASYARGMVGRGVLVNGQSGADVTLDFITDVLTTS